MLADERKIKVIHDMNNLLVKKKRLLLSLPLLLAASLFVVSHTVTPAHAQFTGLVCITASATATSCPTGPPALGPFTVGQTFTVGVFVQGSDAPGGWDVYVRSDPAFVSPTSAALGNLVPSPTLTSICINGVAQTGSCTVNTANGPGVVEVTTIESSGSNACGGISPCSGMAFNITYQVVGATPTTSLSYPTAPGCSTSSVSSPSNVCVLLSDAFGTTLPENIQGANVNIVLPQGVVCIVYPSTSTSCPVGAPSIPVTLGSTYTVGVFVQDSAPLGGFDIYVAVDRQYLNPTDAQLGNLIPSPAGTIRCINGISLEGSCDPPPPNGLGVVQVSTFDSSGTNVCSAAPCSGLAFTITYQVVGVTPSTSPYYPTAAGCSTSSVSSPPDVCVLVADNTGTTVPENTQNANVAIPHSIDPTSSNVSCAPNPMEVFESTTCTVTVTDTAASGAIPPIGPIIWTTDGSGVFVPTNKCQLQPIGPSQPASSTCSIKYLLLGVGIGTTNICAIYVGDAVHTGSTACLTLIATKAHITLSTQVIWDETGQAPPAEGVRAGSNVHDTAVITGGAPPQGVSGTVTYTIYANGACTGASVFTSTVIVRPANDAPPSASFTTPFKGIRGPITYSFNATYNGDGNNFDASTCEPFIITPYPSISSAHWTHHLSLVKTSGQQSWSIGVTNPLASTVQVVIRIQGNSNINPANTFDVICATTCVSISQGFDNAAAATGPITVAAGATVSFSFSQPISNGFANQKITFTATPYWTTGSGYLKGSGQQNGAFAVVP